MIVQRNPTWEPTSIHKHHPDARKGERQECQTEIRVKEIDDRQCQLCHHVYQHSFADKVNHSLGHIIKEDDLFRCGWCKEMVGARVDVLCHIRRAHLKYERIICPICAEVFEVHGNLRRHFARKHPKEKVVCTGAIKAHLASQLKKINETAVENCKNVSIYSSKVKVM